MLEGALNTHKKGSRMDLRKNLEDTREDTD